MSNIFYVDQSHQDDESSTPSGVGPYDHLKAQHLTRLEDGTSVPSDEHKKYFYSEMCNAIRCCRISPDGQEMACGDFYGNLRIYDLVSNKLKHFIEAHNNEVICLAYSP
jgi:WD40 repeat protein